MSDDIKVDDLVFLQNTICKILVNSLTIKNHLYIDTSGVGLYYIANFINNSCCPNAI